MQLPSDLSKFRVDFKRAVKHLEDQYEIDIELGSFTYGDNMFRGKMVSTKRVNGTKKSEKQQFEELAERYGFSKGDYGKSWVEKRTRYKVVGFKPSRRRYPVILEKNGNSRVYANTEYVLRALKERF